MLRLLLLLAFSLALSGCGDFDAPAPQNALPEAANIAIADLCQMVGERCVGIEDDIIIGGYVTSCDRASNFYKTFTIEDATGGVEIMAGLYDLHNIYPEGYYITVNLQDCALSKYYGVLQVGRKAESYSNYPTEYFTSRILLDKHIKRYDVRNPIAPKPLSIKELQQSDCGRLVCIGALHNVSNQYIDVYGVNGDGNWKGYNVFADESGNLITVFTSDYANYANDSVPSENVSITGILQYGEFDSKESFMIKMRDKNDCIATK
jgi:hypothetical protein